MQMTSVQHYEAGQKILAEAERELGNNFCEDSTAKAAIAQAHFSAASVALQVERDAYDSGMTGVWQVALGRAVKPGF